MRYIITTLFIVFASLVYSREITPITNANLPGGYPMWYTPTPDGVYGLFVQGGFNDDDTTRSVIYKFDGQVWSLVVRINTPPNSWPLCMEYWNNKLIIGGQFQNLFGIAGANDVVAYSNGVFEAIGNGIVSTDPISAVYCMAVYQNKLVAGGRLVMTTGAPYHPLAQFDGTAWVNLGGHLLDPSCLTGTAVNQLAVDGNRLYLKGEFEYADTVAVNNIAYFENGTYHSMDGGFPYRECNWAPPAMVISGGNLYTTLWQANAWINAYNDGLQKVMKWDGTHWSTLYATPQPMNAMCSINYCNGEVVVSGYSQHTTGSNAAISFENNSPSPFTGLWDTSHLYRAFTFNDCVYFIGDFKITGDNTMYKFGKTCFATSTGELPLVMEGTEVYPNPFNDNITIRTSETLESVRLTDLSGRRVYETLKQENLSSISTANLAPGVYLLDIKTARGAVQRKLVKSN